MTMLKQYHKKVNHDLLENFLKKIKKIEIDSRALELIKIKIKVLN